jgi:tetratricopeptide (TPR) repeat protein
LIKPRNIVGDLLLKTILVQVLAMLIGINLPCVATDFQMAGFENIKAKNYAKALVCFDTALKEHPHSWQILQTIGNCHMELGQYDKAIADFQKSIEAGGLHAIQCINIAAIYQRLGDTKKALSWLKLACSVDPTQAADPTIQASLIKLQDPENNPTGSPSAQDYRAPSFKGWPKEAMPIKIYARKNIQIPGFHAPFVEILRDSLDQWCKATGDVISYKFVDAAESANVWRQVFFPVATV